MRYEDYREVAGLRMPHRFRTHAWEAEAVAIGELVTNIDAGSYRFGERFEAAHFAPIEGAEVMTEIAPPSR